MIGRFLSDPAGHYVLGLRGERVALRLRQPHDAAVGRKTMARPAGLVVAATIDQKVDRMRSTIYLRSWDLVTLLVSTDLFGQLL